MKIKSILFFLILFGSITVRSQNFAVKSNLLSLANGALNGGIEYAFGMRSTVDFSGSLRPWKRTERYVERYWLLQAEYRYWTCQKFNGSFFGVFLNGAQFNIGGKDMLLGKFKWLKNHRYSGWLTGGGISYGYHLILNRHWNLEVSLGIGVCSVEGERKLPLFRTG